jgi:hypothetical protein
MTDIECSVGKIRMSHVFDLDDKVKIKNKLKRIKKDDLLKFVYFFLKSNKKLFVLYGKTKNKIIDNMSMLKKYSIYSIIKKEYNTLKLDKQFNISTKIIGTEDPFIRDLIKISIKKEVNDVV